MKSKAHPDNTVVVYTMDSCPYCEAAKRLLKQKGVVFEERRVALDDDAEWIRLEKVSGMKTMPQIFLGDRLLGGFSDLKALDESGELDQIL